jgi:hypothetical protein
MMLADERRASNPKPAKRKMKTFCIQDKTGSFLTKIELVSAFPNGEKSLTQTSWSEKIGAAKTFDTKAEAEAVLENLDADNGAVVQPTSIFA